MNLKRLFFLPVLLAVSFVVASPDEEKDAFWEEPLPEFPDIHEQLDQAWHQAGPDERKNGGLEFAVEMRDGNKTYQWMVGIQSASSDEVSENEEAKAMFHASTGHAFEFSSALTSLELVTQGPVRLKNGSIMRGSRPERRVGEVIQVPRDYLMLGFDHLAELSLEIREKGKPQIGLQIGTEPYPEEVIRKTREVYETYSITPEQIRSIVGLAPSLNAFFNLLQRTPGISEILEDMIERPSLFSLISKGIRLGFVTKGEGVESIDPEPWGLDSDIRCYRLPLTVNLNGKVALKVLLVVAHPDDLLAMTAGVIGIVAYHPDRADRSLIVQMR